MELTKAIEILRGSITLKQSEMDSLSLALSILEDKFTPELEVLNNAREEIEQKDEIITQKIAEIEQKDVEIEQKTAEIESMTSQKTELEKRVQDLENPEKEELSVEELPI